MSLFTLSNKIIENGTSNRLYSYSFCVDNSLNHILNVDVYILIPEHFIMYFDNILYLYLHY